MFDVLDVLVPAVPSDAGFVIREHQSGFGLSDEVSLFHRGERLGLVVPAGRAYSNLAAWTGVPTQRQDWSVAILGPVDAPVLSP